MTSYSPEQIYRVRLAIVVRLGPIPLRFSPRADHEMTGALLNDIVREHGADAIASAEPI